MARRRWYADQWVGYRWTWLRPDLVAGITVTAFLIPQVMAYAELAGLPPASGLWAAIGALGLYAVAGSSRQLSAGPESTTALMTAAVLAGTGGDRTTLAAALALDVALVCLIGVAVGMGRFADLLSRPVLVGYMLGIAITMVASQLGSLSRIPTAGGGVPAELRSFVEQIGDVHAATLGLAGATTAVLLIGAARFPRAPVALIGITLAGAATALLHLDRAGVHVVGRFPTDLPVPGLPSVGAADLGSMIVPAMGVAIVGFTDNVLTARAFAGPLPDHRVEPRRELIGMGLANIGAALMHGFPVSSSESRTAIVAASGGRTQLASLATLGTTIVAVLALAPALSRIPTAALGAVVVYAATRLVDISELRRIARFRSSELMVTITTTAAVIAFGVLRGVLIAIGLSVLDLLRRVARPHAAVLGAVPGLAGLHDIDDYPDVAQVPGLLIYRYDSPLFFANAEDFRARAIAALDAAEGTRWFLLNAEAIVDIDLTAVDALEAVRQEIAARGVTLALAHVKRELRSQLRPSGILERVGEDQIFPTLPTAIAAYRAGRSD